MSALAHQSRDHSDHRGWLNDLAGALRRVATRRERTLRTNSGDAVADEQGVVSEYHDRAYGEGGRRTEFKSVIFLIVGVMLDDTIRGTTMLFRRGS